MAGEATAVNPFFRLAHQAIHHIIRRIDMILLLYSYRIVRENVRRQTKTGKQMIGTAGGGAILRVE